MIAVRLMGGLGNQLFQYAFARAKQAQLPGSELCLDLSYLLDPKPAAGTTRREYALDAFRFQPHFLWSPFLLQALMLPKKRRWSAFLQRTVASRFTVVREPTAHYDAALDQQQTEDALYVGYFQDERYFSDQGALIRADLQFAENLPLNEELLAEILDEESVCVHVRRGDFLRSPKFRVTGEGYFTAAMNRLRDELSQPYFYIFSDDPGWCFNTFGDLENVKVISQEIAGGADVAHFRLMAACSHFIISNSSFSWWAAWLGEQETTRVIAPDPWFGVAGYEDFAIIPSRWYKLQV